MKRSAIARIVLYSILIIVLLSILLAGLGLRSFSFSRDEAIEETTYPPAGHSTPARDVKTLCVNWAAGDIYLQTGTVSEIRLEESDDGENPMVIKDSGSRMEVNFSKNAFRNSTQKKNLHITVPESWNGKGLEINAAAVNIYMTGITVSDVVISTASSECEILDCTLNRLELDSAANNLRFVGSLTEADFDGAAIEAVLTLFNNPRSISMDSMSGSLTLNLPEDCGFDLEKESLSGKLYTEFPTTKNGDHYIYGNGHCKIDVNGLSASVTINNAK